MRPILAQAEVALPRGELFALLADLREHWRLTGPWVQVLRVDADSGVVRVRAPLGFARTVHTRVLSSEPPSGLAGEAVAGETRAAVSWTLEDRGAVTLVTLRADLISAGRADRVLLALGGRHWLRRRLSATLARLDMVGPQAR